MTGANGYIGSHIVKELLENQYVVSGLVRDLERSEKFDHLYKLRYSKSNLTLKETDILSEQSILDSLDEVNYIIHCASPAVAYSRDPWKDIYYPTVQSCKAMLAAASQIKSLKRVVLTSSAATITNRGKSGTIFTENDWNSKSDIRTDPYFVAKTSAEKWAWGFMHGTNPSFKFISINPTFTFGPSLNHTLNISPEYIRDLINGTYPYIFDLTGGLVDVRDVAKSHRLALESKNASGRYICNAEHWSSKEIVSYLNTKNFHKAKLPTREIKSDFGNAVIRLLTYFYPNWRGRYLRQHIGRPATFANKKIKSELGIRFTPIEKTMDDTVMSLMRWGHLRL